jgi:hypothetical protein
MSSCGGTHNPGAAFVFFLAKTITFVYYLGRGAVGREIMFVTKRARSLALFSAILLFEIILVSRAAPYREGSWRFASGLLDTYYSPQKK